MPVVAEAAYPITASGASDPDYEISYVPGTLIITPVPLTITADGKAKVYGAAMPALTASYSGLVNGDTPASLAGLPMVTTAATASSHVGSYAITVSGAASGDYVIGYVSGSLSVTPAALTITADDQTKVYGAALPTLSASYTGWVNGDTAASLASLPTHGTAATAAGRVGSYAITAGGAVSGDYVIGYVTGSLIVTPAPLTITPNDAIKVYGADVPALSAGDGGFVNGDTAASLTTRPTLGTSATAASDVGSYAITAGGASSIDYTIGYVTGNLVITPAPTTTMAGLSTSTPVLGQALTLYAVVHVAGLGVGVPTGTVTFTDGTTPIGTAPLITAGGETTATLITSSLGPGPHTVTATYNGDGNDTGSSAATTFAVGRDTPTTIAGPSTFTPVRGQIIQVYSVVQGRAGPPAPTGTVGFYNGTTLIAAEPLVTQGGQTLLPIPTGIAMGTYTFRTVYSGDANYLAGGATTTFTVGPDSTTMVVAPSDFARRAWRSTRSSPSPRRARGRRPGRSRSSSARRCSPPSRSG